MKTSQAALSQHKNITFFSGCYTLSYCLQHHAIYLSFSLNFYFIPLCNKYILFNSYKTLVLMIEIKYTSLHLFNSLLSFLKHLLCATVQKGKKTDIKSKYMLLWNRCMKRWSPIHDHI